jgi:glutaredoxin 3
LVITDAQKDRISLVTGNVEIYTTETCPYCIEAKELLTKNQINFNKDKGKQYTITNMSDLPQSVQEVLPTGHSSVPIIIVNRKFIGGLDDLKRILKAPYVRAVLR